MKDDSVLEDISNLFMMISYHNNIQRFVKCTTCFFAS